MFLVFPLSPPVAPAACLAYLMLICPILGEFTSHMSYTTLLNIDLLPPTLYAGLVESQFIIHNRTDSLSTDNASSFAPHTPSYPIIPLQ
ncbi:uncharacterized protein BDW43DRAFT_53433 [Aspergillus alliaceus]|uniref:uncharacterized protein n=1 Tax=Petromyces alliaceus TaxID=209559 RepID=UPI0012A7577D|nr:uncharacterized protein BDW43DRAFT_53433 [Aspergillus alliaceus]KAB8234762.1 hypothetical protein BDW43DRAFT_53433 [Aspergillus alliaceus]